MRSTSIDAVVSSILRICVEVNMAVYEPWKTGVVAEIRSTATAGGLLEMEKIIPSLIVSVREPRGGLRCHRLGCRKIP